MAGCCGRSIAPAHCPGRRRWARETGRAPAEPKPRRSAARQATARVAATHTARATPSSRRPERKKCGRGEWDHRARAIHPPSSKERAPGRRRSQTSRWPPALVPEAEYGRPVPLVGTDRLVRLTTAPGNRLTSGAAFEVCTRNSSTASSGISESRLPKALMAGSAPPDACAGSRPPTPRCWRSSHPP